MDIVIVNYNTRDDLLACLASLQAAQDGEILVVDNGSSDGSVAMVRHAFPTVEVIENENNVGYGAAANIGISHCSSEHVLLLNSDTRLVGGSFAELESYMTSHERAGVVGPRLLNRDGTRQRSCYPFPSPFDLYVRERIEDWLFDRVPPLRARSLKWWEHDRPRIVPYVLGAALAIKRNAFQQIGGFNQAYFMYFEEVDLCYRLANAGWQVHFAPLLTLEHLGGSSTAHQRAEMQIHFYQSNVEFYRRNYPRHRLTELLILMRTGFVFRLLRDSLRLRGTREPGEKLELAEKIDVWKRGLVVG